MIKSIFSSAGKSIAREVRLYSFIAMLSMIFLTAQKGFCSYIAEFLRAGGMSMGMG